MSTLTQRFPQSTQGSQMNLRSRIKTHVDLAYWYLAGFYIVGVLAFSIFKPQR